MPCSPFHVDSEGKESMALGDMWYMHRGYQAVGMISRRRCGTIVTHTTMNALAVIRYADETGRHVSRSSCIIVVGTLEVKKFSRVLCYVPRPDTVSVYKPAYRDQSRQEILI